MRKKEKEGNSFFSSPNWPRLFLLLIVQLEGDQHSRFVLLPSNGITCLLVRHPERVALEGDAPAPTLGRGRVDPQKQARIRGKAPRQELWAAGGDVHKQMMGRVRKYLKRAVLH